MATKLEVYNGALTLLGARTLLTVTDNRTERRTLDAVYAQTFDFMIEAAMWHFAARSEELSPSDTQTSNFGWQYVYEKPDDYIRLILICDNERFTPTLESYSDEGDYFLADCSLLYIQYVSDDINYGADPGKWSASFVTAFQDELAYRAAPQMQNVPANLRDWLVKKKRQSLYYAKGKSAVNSPRSDLPVGRLVRARAGNRYINAMRRTPYA